MSPVSIREIIEKASSCDHTVAASLGMSVLSDWFAPILTQQLHHFCLDSRKIAPCDGYVLLASTTADDTQNIMNAHRYIDAVKGVASFIISEIDTAKLNIDDTTIPVLYVPQIRTVLGDLIAARLQLQAPVTLPTVVAVTGTNGKTTVSQLIAQLCQASGVPSAIMGTAGNGRLGHLTQAANTTGDVLMVHEFLYQMAKDGVQLVALEASSHGLDQYRLQGVPVAVAVYTNLSHDHLDYHRDMNDYLKAKARLFDQVLFPTLQYGIINADAEYQLFIDTKQYPIYRYSQKDSTAEYFAKTITPSLDGVVIDMTTMLGQMTVHSPLLGVFNVDNLMASMAAFLALYPQQIDVLPALITQLQGARGRMQRAASKTGSFIVDYAHTPDALVQVLSSLRKHCDGKLIAVFGCGGDRDRTKRPLMTRAGLDYADHVILTADNPRSEDPNAILKDMQHGLSCEDHYKMTIEADRRQAIELAVRTARSHDIVVIAGKGHETYQEIKGVRHDFDDLAILDEFLNKFNK